MVQINYITDREQQVLKFGGQSYSKADLPALAEKNEALFCFLSLWWDKNNYIKVKTSGSTGEPKIIIVDKNKMVVSAITTCKYFSLNKDMSALLCMDLKYIGAMMMVVRSLVCGMSLIVTEPSGHPLERLAGEKIDFAAMVPLQVYNSLNVISEKYSLEQIGKLIIGGGAIDRVLEDKISVLPNEVFSVYGMTETLSHIALRRLTGKDASSRYYPFEYVNLSISDKSTLVIDAPYVCDDILVTNDIAEIFDNGGFIVKGRIDNVINSGGIKIIPEEIEEILRKYYSFPFTLTSVPDEKLGNAVVLISENFISLEKLKGILPKYHIPKHIFLTESIPLTETGKINRALVREVALRLYSQSLSV